MTETQLPVAKYTVANKYGNCKHEPTLHAHIKQRVNLKSFHLRFKQLKSFTTLSTTAPPS